MTTQRELEDRLSRMEATAAREGDAGDDQFSLRLLRKWSTPDLRRLEGLLARVESGDPSAALTVAEQAWIDQTTEGARKSAGLPDG
jgi:hypothetical protein